MSFPKLLVCLALLLFGTISVIALFKKSSTELDQSHQVAIPVEVSVDQQVGEIIPASTMDRAPLPEVVMFSSATSSMLPQSIVTLPASLPEVDRIQELFNINDPQLPIVETITYKSRVSWLNGRPAWLSDYASHYNTSRHFIARSLNGKTDYLKQNVAEGNRFNVFRLDKNIEFHLVVDTSRCRMWFFYLDKDETSPVLIKTYPVCLGRLDPSKASGLLTPLGRYSLGDRVAVYNSKSKGTYQGQTIDMITVFGTRWIPFSKELGETTAPAKGFGLHGTPWKAGTNGQFIEESNSIGKYESDGCIRLMTSDIEELYAVVISKPATIEIVTDVNQSSLAGSFNIALLKAN